jgi:hypothetical protein
MQKYHDSVPVFKTILAKLGVSTCLPVNLYFINPVAKVDALVGELVDSLKKAQVLDAINLIVTGLHGFAEVQTHLILLFIFLTSYN